MLYFSYNDFMDCMGNAKLNEVTNIQEEVASYERKNGLYIQENKNHIIEGLKTKEEILKFLKDLFDFEGTNTELMQYYNTDKLKSDKNNEENITYKIKNKEIFIFLKVIDKIDTNLSYKIFDHAVKIIEKWNNHELKERKIKPIVIPIVIYIGQKKINNYNNKINNNIKYIIYDRNNIKFSYSMVDINDFDIDELKQMKSITANELILIKNKYLQENL